MRTIWVTTRFTALHYWKDAPDEVSFLRHPHRHEFHVKLEVEVTSLDREIEFFILKKWLDEEVKQYQLNGVYEYSCEQFALLILSRYKDIHARYKEIFISVTVSEDGENGATVSITGDKSVKSY